MTKTKPSPWRPFPDPRKRGFLVAPFGPGCYEIRHRGQKICFGKSGHVAHRMSSLLPSPLGTGTRKHQGKRQYIKGNLTSVEYRTFACRTSDAATALEAKLKAKGGYRFST